MKEPKASYKHFIPRLSLSIERYTEHVPGDGKYYIVSEGHVLEGFRSLKKAEEKFRELVKESGYIPEKMPTRPRSAAEVAAEAYLDAADLYWAESYKYRQKGGKGGRGGV